MGKGIAAEFKKRYPDMFEDYVRRCDRGEVKPGLPYAWTATAPTVIDFPTKRHWRGGSRLEWVAEGLPRLAQLCDDLRLRSIAVPPLGCGHGGLAWADVRLLIYEHLGGLAVRTLLFVQREKCRRQRRCKTGFDL